MLTASQGEETDLHKESGPLATKKADSKTLTGGLALAATTTAGFGESKNATRPND